MTSLKQYWTAGVALVALAGAIPVANAQDSNTPGIVRISDGSPRIVAQPVSFHGHYSSQTVSTNEGYECDQCQNGRCQGCNLFRESYCKNSPDHGYSPPAKYPLHRRGVQYNSYFPNQWYGTPGGGVAGGYPTVYQPTDTTQMGYYYQHVRSWQPNPNVLPQRPVPAQWHIVAPAAQHKWAHGAGGNASGRYCENCPVEGGTISPQPIQPTPNPSPEAALPPLPREIQNTAESEHIRRAAF